MAKIDIEVRCLETWFPVDAPQDEQSPFRRSTLGLVADLMMALTLSINDLSGLEGEGALGSSDLSVTYTQRADQDFNVPDIDVVITVNGVGTAPEASTALTPELWLSALHEMLLRRLRLMIKHLERVPVVDLAVGVGSSVGCRIDGDHITQSWGTMQHSLN